MAHGFHALAMSTIDGIQACGQSNAVVAHFKAPYPPIRLVHHRHLDLRGLCVVHDVTECLLHDENNLGRFGALGQRHIIGRLDIPLEPDTPALQQRFNTMAQPGLCRKTRQAIPVAIKKGMDQRPEITYELLNEGGLFSGL